LQYGERWLVAALTTTVAAAAGSVPSGVYLQHTDTSFDFNVLEPKR